MLNTYKIDPKWIQWFIGLADAEAIFRPFLKNGRKILL